MGSRIRLALTSRFRSHSSTSGAVVSSCVDFCPQKVVLCPLPCCPRELGGLDRQYGRFTKKLEEISGRHEIRYRK